MRTPSFCCDIRLGIATTAYLGPFCAASRRSRSEGLLGAVARYLHGSPRPCWSASIRGVFLAGQMDAEERRDSRKERRRRATKRERRFCDRRADGKDNSKRIARAGLCGEC